MSLAASAAESKVVALFVHALHRSSAIALNTDLTAFIAYDHRLSAAASDIGLSRLRMSGKHLLPTRSSAS